MKKYLPITLSVTALLLVACGGNDETPAAEAPAAETSAELDPAQCGETEFYEANVEFCANTGVAGEVDAAAEGSVTTEEGSYVEYPDGYHAVISEVTAGPADETLISPDEPEMDGQVTVTMTITNKGDAPIALNNDSFGTSPVRLLYGENRYEAQGWMTDGGVGDLPQQLVPGTSAEFATDFTLPTAETAGPLAVEFNPDASVYLTYTFTDVETLIN
jgi:hypothetical protein